MIKYFELRKKLSKQFTQKFFADKAGFKNHSLCNLIINNKRDLTSDSLKKFTTAMELSGIVLNYFNALVLFNQASNQKDKVSHFNVLQRIISQKDFYSLKNNQENFFSKWFFPALRELTVESDWNEDYSILASSLSPSISFEEAKHGVEFMLETGIIDKNGDIYSLCDENINDDDIPIHIKKRVRREAFLRSVETLDSLSPKERYATYSTFTTDRKTYDEITKLYDKFKSDVFDKILDNNTKENREVFQMTYNISPLSKPLNKR